MNRALYAQLKTTVQEVALQLTRLTGQEWTLRANEVDDTMYFHIVSGNAELSITTAYNKPSHFAVSGNTPRGADRQYVRVYEQNIVDGQPRGWNEFKFSSITTAIDKGAEKTAKDIIRRFLPDYLKAVQMTVNRIDRDAEYASTRRSNLEAVAAEVGENLRSDYRPIHGCDAVLEPVTNFHHYMGRDSSGIRVEVSADNKDVDMKLANLSVLQARAILKIMKTWHTA